MSQPLPPRGLDHLVLPSPDLEAHAAFYRRLGFQLGARNAHPWGTENRLVQFDGCFLELITLGAAADPPAPAPRRFSFGDHVRTWLGRGRGGLSMLAFSSTDAAGDAERIKFAGIADYEPFRFGRKGKRADGSDVELAFTLAFAPPAAAPDLCFFFCQHHFPGNFWNAALQQHANTALGVSRVVVIGADPRTATPPLSRILGVEARFEPQGATMETGNGALSFWSPEAARGTFCDDPVFANDPQARFAAVVFRVGSLAAAGQALSEGGVPHERREGRLLVASSAAFGVLLAFEEARGEP